MRSHRLYHPERLATGDEVTIGGGDAHYLTRVLRLPAGAELVLFDGRGGEYEATIVDLGRRSVTVRIGAHRTVERESPLAVTLAQGVSRGDRMDHVIQKCTELGVAAVVPLDCERSVVRLDPRRAETRREHWQKVAAGACRQCGRNRLPAIAPVTSLGDWLARSEPSARLILRPATGQALAGLASPDGPLTLLIGPEGGFSDEEHSAASRAGYQAVSLGPRVLRTETAAVVALAAVQTLWGDL